MRSNHLQFKLLLTKQFLVIYTTSKMQKTSQIVLLIAFLVFMATTSMALPNQIQVASSNELHQNQTSISYSFTVGFFFSVVFLNKDSRMIIVC